MCSTQDSTGVCVCVCAPVFVCALGWTGDPTGVYHWAAGINTSIPTASKWKEHQLGEAMSSADR